MPCVRAGLLSRCPETPAWIRAQGSHHALLQSGGEPASTALGGGRSSLGVLCPVRALCIYVDRTRSFRSSEQLFVCYGGQQEGKAVSKQRLAHWIVDAIALAYQSQGKPCPLGVRAQSTWCVASSDAKVHGASLADICRGAGWATPNTFVRFYNLCVEPVSSRVLGNRYVAGRAGRCHACCAISPHPGIRAPVFLLQFSSPDGEPWWSSSSTPGSQTGRSSLTPGPVLVLARPGLRSAPVLG